MTKTLCLLALALGLGLSACGHPTAHGRTLPNVVLISIDTLRADHLGTYGYSRETSPEIDALAERSIVFDAAYSHSPKTAPSHMSLLTGVVPDLHGVENLQEDVENRALPPGLPTLAEILREHGYATAAVTGGGHVIAKVGFDRGFESFATSNQGERVFELGWRKIKNRGDRPFFLFLHTYEVHDPYTPPEPFHDMYVDPAYDGNLISSREEMRDVSEKWQERHERFWSTVKSEDPADLRRLQDLYDGSIRYVDSLLGDFLRRLADKQLDEDTIVVLVADHGEEFQDHGGFLHETVYQELLHVPLILHVPERFAGGVGAQRVAHTVRLIDVLPTLLGLTGVPVPDHAQGRNLLELLDGSADEERSVFSTWPRQGLYAMRRGQYKLIERPSWRVKRGEPGLELYDLAADPEERTNLALAPAPDQQQVLAGLLDELRRIRSAAEQFRTSFESGAEIELSTEEREALKGLGYLK